MLNCYACKKNNSKSDFGFSLNFILAITFSLYLTHFRSFAIQSSSYFELQKQMRMKFLSKSFVHVCVCYIFFFASSFGFLKFILHLSKYRANVKEAISGSIAVKSCIKMCENNFNVNPDVCVCAWERAKLKKSNQHERKEEKQEREQKSCIYLWSVCLAKRTLPVIANESLELIRPHQIHINFNGILVSQHRHWHHHHHHQKQRQQHQLQWRWNGNSLNQTINVTRKEKTVLSIQLIYLIFAATCKYGFHSIHIDDSQAVWYYAVVCVCVCAIEIEDWESKRN